MNLETFKLKANETERLKLRQLENQKLTFSNDLELSKTNFEKFQGSIWLVDLLVLLMLNSSLLMKKLVLIEQLVFDD